MKEVFSMVSANEKASELIKFLDNNLSSNKNKFTELGFSVNLLPSDAYDICYQNGDEEEINLILSFNCNGENQAKNLESISWYFIKRGKHQIAKFNFLNQIVYCNGDSTIHLQSLHSNLDKISGALGNI